MRDRTLIITGGNSGLGYECAKAAAGYPETHVVMACRDEQRAQEAVEKLKAETGASRIEAMRLDLASLASVRDFSQRLISRSDLPPAHALVCNAGMQVVSGVSYTEDGIETTFGVNHLGHFLLANILLHRLNTLARIIFVGSGAHDPEQFTGMPAPRYSSALSLARPEEYPDEVWRRDSPEVAGRRRYTTSKLCNLLCAYELDRRLKASGLSSEARPIAVNVFDPGLMPGTGLARDYKPWQRAAWKYVFPLLRLMSSSVKTADESGANLAALALAPEFARTSGKYFVGLEARRSSRESYDLGKGTDLWETSESLAGSAEWAPALTNFANIR